MNDWYGFEKGGDRKSKEKIFPLKIVDEPATQTDLATTYGITKQTMNNYMRLAKVIPELEDLVDTGILAPTTELVSPKVSDSPNVTQSDIIEIFLMALNLCSKL